MAVTSPAFGMVKMTLDQVVGVIAMWNRLVTASWTVSVISSMGPAIVAGGMRSGMACVDCNHVLIHMIFVRMVQVAIVQVVGVPFVLDGRMTARWAMFMRVSLMKTT
jgi:hypothetical protein